jgi:hypothetical protein
MVIPGPDIWLFYSNDIESLCLKKISHTKSYEKGYEDF